MGENKREREREKDISQCLPRNALQGFGCSQVRRSEGHEVRAGVNLNGNGRREGKERNLVSQACEKHDSREAVQRLC